MAIRTSSGEDNLDALDIPAVCRRSGTGRSFVYEEIRAGRLIARKLGRLTRILRADYDTWLAAAPPISPANPSPARITGRPKSAPVPSAPSVPNDVNRERWTTPTGAADLPRPTDDPTNGASRRHVWPGGHR
jgi:excisionase family DNA binding protein